MNNNLADQNRALSEEGLDAVTGAFFRYDRFDASESP